MISILKQNLNLKLVSFEVSNDIGISMSLTHLVGKWGPTIPMVSSKISRYIIIKNTSSDWDRCSVP